MLCELGLEYETREILPRSDAMNDPDFRRVSQRGKVPILEDGDLVIGESGAIVFYLADRYRERAVLAPEPATPDRARFDDVCLFTLTELDASLYVIRRHEGLPEIYGASETAVSAARAYFVRQAAEMERRLSDGRPHLMGEEFSAADLLLATCLGWAGFVGIQLPEILARHLTLVSGREAYKRAVGKNFTPAAMAMLGRPPGGAAELGHPEASERA
jgi:glutathione S-transferase